MTARHAVLVKLLAGLMGAANLDASDLFGSEHDWISVGCTNVLNAFLFGLGGIFSLLGRHDIGSLVSNLVGILGNVGTHLVHAGTRCGNLLAQLVSLLASLLSRLGDIGARGRNALVERVGNLTEGSLSSLRNLLASLGTGARSDEDAGDNADGGTHEGCKGDTRGVFG